MNKVSKIILMLLIVILAISSYFFIKELVKNSTCSADILKELGYTVKGNSWGYRIIAETMDKLNITFGKPNKVSDDLEKENNILMEKVKMLIQGEYNE